VKARKRFGQHFLEPAWARKVVDAIALARRRSSKSARPRAPSPALAARKHVVAIDSIAIWRPRSPASSWGLRVVRDFLTIDLDSLALPPGPASPATAINVSTPILSRLVDLTLANAGFRDRP
jgi:hypothetical protein